MEESLLTLGTPDVRVFCVRCGAELPGSDPGGGQVRLSVCHPSCCSDELSAPVATRSMIISETSIWRED